VDSPKKDLKTVPLPKTHQMNNTNTNYPLFLKNNDSLSISNFKISNFQLNSTTDVTFQIKFLTENFLANERIIIRFLAHIFPDNYGNLDFYNLLILKTSI
jgi:hypothetical protein